jgi:hypothetical protein
MIALLIFNNQKSKSINEKAEQSQRFADPKMLLNVKSEQRWGKIWTRV